MERVAGEEEGEGAEGELGVVEDQYHGVRYGVNDTPPWCKKRACHAFPIAKNIRTSGSSSSSPVFVSYSEERYFLAIFDVFHVF